MTIDPIALRRKFHFFRAHAHGIYFDNASTSQKPDATIQAMRRFWQCAANVGRSSHAMASTLTQDIDDVRNKSTAFLHARNASEIAFTSGATQSLNMVALSWGLHNLRHGDEIMYCPEDHKSCVLPWVNLRHILAHFGIDITLVPFKNTFAGDADIDDLLSKITPKTRLIALTHIHNAYGAKTDVEKIRPAIGNDIVLSLDAAQSVGHMPVDVQALGVDFLSFSGHKMFAATGIGVLWVHERMHAMLRPVIAGGRDARTGAMETVARPRMPELLESGTPNIAGILSLGAAISFTEEIGLRAIHERLRFLTQYLIKGLRRVSGISFVRGPAVCHCDAGYGIVSFRIDGMASHDAGFILDRQNIFVRTGTHCQSEADDQDGSIRASLQIYNTEEEIDSFVDAIGTIVASL